MDVSAESLSSFTKVILHDILLSQADLVGHYLLDEENDGMVVRVTPDAFTTQIAAWRDSSHTTGDKVNLVALIVAVSAKIKEIVREARVKGDPNEEKPEVKQEIPTGEQHRVDEEVLRKLNELSINKKNDLSHLHKHVPYFKGNANESFKDWLYVVERSIKCSGIKEENIVSFVSHFLRDDALQALISFERDSKSPTDWKELKKFLESMFLPEDFQWKLRTEITELRLRNGNMDEYITRFRKLSSKLENMSEADIIFFFIKGLTPEIMKDVMKDHPTTLTEAIAVARIVGNISGLRTRNEVFTVKHTNTKFYKRDFNNNRVYENKKKFSGYNNNKYVSKFNNKKNKNFNQGKYKNRPTSNVTCYKCKLSGHYAKDCRVQKSNVVTSNVRTDIVAMCKDGDTSLLNAFGLVNDIKLTVYFDSGATASIISINVVRKNDLKMNESNVLVKTADGKVGNVLGVTDVMKVEVHGHVCYLQLLVMNTDEHDVLLGLDWFMATGAGLFPADKILKFPSTRIFLGDHTKSQTLYDNEVMVSEVVDEEDIEGEYYWEPLSDKELSEFKIKPETKLVPAQQHIFRNVMKELLEAFAFTLDDLKTCSVNKHVIRVMDVAPININPYRRSLKENELLQAEVESMLKMDIIEHSKSSWSAPVVLIPKKDIK